MKSRQKKQFFYSLLLVFTLCFLFLANTVWQIYQAHIVYDKEVQRKAILFHNTFSGYVTDHIDQPEIIRTKVARLIQEEPLIKEITVYRQQGEAFVSLASSNSDKELEILDNITSSTAWKEDRSTAVLDQDPRTNERVWSVVSPMHDLKGEKIGLINTRLSIADITLLSTSAYQRTIIFSILSCLFLILILVNHIKYSKTADYLDQFTALTRIKESFISANSYAIRLPAIYIKNTITLFKNAYGGQLDQTANTQIDSIISSSAEVAELIVSLNDLIRVEFGELEIIRQLTDPVDSMSEIVQELQPTSFVKGITVTHDIPLTRARINTDPVRLKQILLTTLTSVIRYLDKGSVEMRHELVSSNDWAIVITCPNLPLSSDSISKISNGEIDFGKRTTEAEKSLIELILSFWSSNRMIQRIGGTLTATSSPDSGTTIRILFPIKEIDGQSAQMS